jgi:hypothetical protein
MRYRRNKTVATEGSHAGAQAHKQVMEVEILRKITQLPGLEQAESKAGRPLSA